MPTTGAELSRELDLQVDKAYTGYLDPAKKNRLFLMAYIQLAEKKYNQMDRQQVYDELTHFVKTDVPVQMRSDKIYTFPLQVNTAVFSGGVLTITTWKENQLQVNDTVNYSARKGRVNTRYISSCDRKCISICNARYNRRARNINQTRKTT
jgi:hypothetical protein